MEDDRELDIPQISTWETLKKEIIEQFHRSNASWMARKSLKHLKQMRVVRDYVKDLSSFMLDRKKYV